MENLTAMALKLKELDRLVVKAIIDSNGNAFAEQVSLFNETKKRIKKELLKNPVMILPELEDTVARGILQAISIGKLLPGEKALKGSPLGEVLNDELTWEELEILIFDEFYIWFGPYEYVEKLYNIGSLILAVGHLPKHLSSFVDEARQCYAFHQYAAVYSLCRTMLEICVRDLSIKYEIIPGDTYKVKYQRNKKSDLINLIDQLCDKIHPLGKYRDQLHNVRMKGSVEYFV